MTQPLDINKLARETAKECWGYILQDGKLPAKTIERHILAALTKLTADKDAEIARHMAALKVATDALKQCKKYAGEYKTEWIAEDALTQIEKELKP